MRRRWRNTVQDVESQPEANLSTDHYPLKAKLRVRLKAKLEPERKRAAKYQKADEDTRLKYNEYIQDAGGLGERGMKDTVDLIGRAAEECLQEKEKSHRMKFPWSQETDDWFWLRGEFILARDVSSITWANK